MFNIELPTNREYWGNKLELLVKEIKRDNPKFEVRFKNKSWLNKVISKILFFNKSYMTSYVTTLFGKVYFPDEDNYKNRPYNSFCILAHEWVHLNDSKKWKLLFSFSYLLPQILAVFSLLSILAIWFSNLWLLSLISLVFLAPIPSWFRYHWEMKGYLISAFVDRLTDYFNPKDYVSSFCDGSYYFMWPFSKDVEVEFMSFNYAFDRWERAKRFGYANVDKCKNEVVNTDIHKKLLKILVGEK